MQLQSDAPESGKLKRILVVQTAFIGDVILTLPLLQVLKRYLPAAELHFLTIPVSRNVVETSPVLTRLWLYDKHGRDRGVRNLFHLAAQLREVRFDAAVVPHRSLRSALLVRLAGISLRIGFDRSAGSLLFNRLVKYRSGIHEIERNLSLLAPLGISPQGKELPEIVADESDERRVNEWLARHNLPAHRELVCLAPGSVWATKRWPAPYWGRLADLIAAAGKMPLFIGSEKDRFLLPQIRKHSKAPWLEAMGEFTLRQSTVLIRRCRLLISNDSAPTHLGVAARTPVLTIFGPTVPAFGFYPYGECDRVAEIKGLECRPCSIHGGRKCPRGHFKCMLELVPEAVYQIAEEMLNGHCAD